VLGGESLPIAAGHVLIKKLTRGNPTMAAKFEALPGSWSFFEVYF
jgi:hypothetical protein